MKYLVSDLAPGVYAVAVEDTASWDAPTYTNFYLLHRGEQVILVDAGLKDYQSILLGVLKQIGASAEQVSHVLLTHGHHDHVAGARYFDQAVKYIHEQDLFLLSEKMRPQFTKYTQVREHVYCAPAVPGLDIILVNSHTAGSVAIYDHASKVLFAGDFFCFWGEPLPEGQLVSYGGQTRKESCQYVVDQAASGEADSFLQGLGRLLTYQPEFFATGHGVVLKGDINQFLKDLWESGNSAKA